MSLRTTARPLQRSAELLRGLGATVVLAVLVLGPPIALSRWSDWPVTGTPTWDQIRDLPTTVVSDTALLTTLTVALWAAWAVFVLCVIVEIAAEARGRAAVHIGPAGPLQVIARTLVASVVMTIGSLGPIAARSSPAPNPASAAPAPAPTAHSAEPAPDHPAPAEPAGPLADEPAPVEPAGEPAVIEVVPDDDPWTLAATHLGDGARWKELWDANRDRLQPDGNRWTVAHHIEPGWTLVLSGAHPPAPVPALDARIAVVAGDTAWDLAEAHLGDGHRWTDLFDANRDLPQPDGRTWTDPELLRPGWQLTLPSNIVPTAVPVAAAAGTEEPAAPPAGTGSATGSTSTTEPGPNEPADASAEVEAEEPSDTDAPEITVPTTRSPSAPSVERGAEAPPRQPATPPRPPDAPSSPEPNSADDPRAEGPDESPTVTPPTTVVASNVGAGSDHAEESTAGDSEDGPDEGATAPTRPLLGVAGTMLTVALLRAWRRRRAARSAVLPLEVVPPPLPRRARPVARQLLAGNDQAAVDRVDAALANLAAGLRPRGGQPCVQPRVVQVGADRIEVLMDRAEPDTPAPWRPEASGLVWVLEATDAAGMTISDDAPPLPALVTVGVGESDILLDLEAFGVIALDGDLGACRALARSMVTELSARAEGTIAIDVVADDLPAVVEGLDGVRVVANWDAADTDTIDTSARLLDAGRWPHTFAARASGRVTDSWAPTIWLTDQTDHPRCQAALDAIAARPGAGTAIVVAGHDPGPGLRIVLDSEGGFDIPDLGLSGQAQGLAADTVDQIVELLDDATRTPLALPLDFPSNGNGNGDTEPDQDPAPMPATGPAAPTRLSGGEGEVGYDDPDYTVVVRLCGEIRVEGGKARLPHRETAVTAYVALHGEVDLDQIRDAVWGGTDVSRKTVQNAISTARRTLDGAVCAVEDGRVAPGEGLITDLELVRRRVAYATHQADPQTKADTLHGALEWATGRVCSYPAAASRSLTWIDLENWAAHAESVVGAVASDLARLYLDLGDPAGACWAAQRGINATSPRDELTVLLVRGYELAGDDSAARTTLRSYSRYSTEIGIDEHSEELRALLHRHLPANSRAAS